jgi:iron complex outermembrane receptor protein
LGLSANLEWQNGDYTYTSITGVDQVENFQFTDVDGGVLDFNIGALGSAGFFSANTGDGLDDHQQLTQEFRLARQKDDFFFQTGVYYLKDDSNVKTLDFISGAEDIVRQETDSVAVFGQVEFEASEDFVVTLGARATWDDKKLRVIPGVNSPSPPGSINVNDSFLSWDVAFTYATSENVSIYGRLANASRGPVTLGRFGFTSSADTETSDSVEIGFKSDLFEGRGRWNASLYAFRNDDQQLTATGGVGNRNQLLNADSVKGNGLETSFEVLLTDNLFLIANVSYNKTEIVDPGLLDELAGAAPSVTPLDPIVDTTRIGGFGFPVTDVSIHGNPLPRSPEMMANIILQYTVPQDNGEFYFHTDWNYRGESNLFLHETVEFVADERWLGGVRVGYRSDSGYDLALVGRNITDKLTVDGGINFNNLTAFINEPAFWGVEFRRDW